MKHFDERVLSLGMIRDYILKFFPDLLWWDGFSKHEKFNPNKSYKHRQGMPNEIRIEFDSDDINRNWKNSNLTAVLLDQLGYSFCVYYVEGGRSPHIHIYDLDELELLTIKQREEYRKKFLTKICPLNSNPDYGLCDERHLCALEFVNHFKYDKPKELLHYFWNGRNSGIDNYIKYNVLFGKAKKINSIVQSELKFGDLLKNKRREAILNICEFEKVFEKYNIPYDRKLAMCPFHEDSNNSLSFSNDKGLWICFGCEEKGDVITLIKKLKELNNGKKK